MFHHRRKHLATRLQSTCVDEVVPKTREDVIQNYAKHLSAQPVAVSVTSTVAPVRPAVRFSIRVVDPDGDGETTLRCLQTPVGPVSTKTPRPVSFDSELMSQAERLDKEYEQRRNAYVERTLLQ